MNELESTIRLINKLTEWTDKICTLFYTTEGHAEISEENLKETFNKFILANFSNAQVEEINDLTTKFKNLSYDEKNSYFKSDSIYVIDCSNIDKENMHIFNAVHDINKDKKITFIYYSNQEKLRDYLSITQAYHLRDRVLEKIDDALCKLYNYNELKSEISEVNNNSNKKPKL
jgi:hypothetical protein